MKKSKEIQHCTLSNAVLQTNSKYESKEIDQPIFYCDESQHILLVFQKYLLLTPYAPWFEFNRIPFQQLHQQSTKRKPNAIFLSIRRKKRKKEERPANLQISQPLAYYSIDQVFCFCFFFLDLLLNYNYRLNHHFFSVL